MSTDHHPLTVVQGPQNLQEFMAQALAMEQDAAERYTEFADTLEQHQANVQRWYTIRRQRGEM